MEPHLPAGVRPIHAALLVATLTVGLALDVLTALPGQIALSAVAWGVLLYVLRHMDLPERSGLMACLVIATAGEIFLSLVWGVYTYRLDNVPLFVPPGHVMMLLLGIELARRLSRRMADAVLASAALYAVAVAAAGIDTFAIPLLAALAIISFALPSHRPLYASTFILALVLELYGTWLGNWTWSREVPVLGLVTTNPPGVASAFYAVLDALVACTAFVLSRRFRPGARHVKQARHVFDTRLHPASSTGAAANSSAATNA